MKNSEQAQEMEKQDSNKEGYHQHRKLQELQKLYAEGADSRKLKSMLYGGWGTWKTTLACTMPRPILFQTFDPGGDKIYHVQKGIEDGSIIVDRRFQERTWEDSENRFREWNDDYKKMKTEGTFNEIGTYVLDSLTTFQRFVVDASMDGNVKNQNVSRNMPVKVPQMRDYNVQGAAIEYAISDMLELPCHVLILAHSEEGRDDDDLMYCDPLITGKKLRNRLPVLFDEIYITKETRKGIELMTRPKNFYKAKSRVAKFSPKIFDAYAIENPKDFSFTRDILYHAGYCSKEEIIELEEFPEAEIPEEK